MSTPRFRVWHKKEKIMFRQMFNLTDTTTNLEYEWDAYNVTQLEFSVALFPSDGDEIILMQSTGLKDKNGVEIFDGDCLRRAHGVVHEVFYSDDNAGFYLGRHAYTKLDCHRARKGEVIGNIYQNPDLLTKSAK